MTEIINKLFKDREKELIREFLEDWFELKAEEFDDDMIKNFEEYWETRLKE